MQSQIQTHRHVGELEITHRYELDQFTPPWLDGHINYNNYEEFEQFHGVIHRGHVLDIDRTLSYLSSALQHAADYDDDYNALPLGETKAVAAVISALQKQFPAWFGKSDALADLDLPCSDYHLKSIELNELYFAGEIFVETTAVEDTWRDHLRVAVPILALVLDEIGRQMDADRSTQVESAHRKIKTAVIGIAAEYDLSTEQLTEATGEAESLWAGRNDR